MKALSISLACALALAALACGPTPDPDDDTAPSPETLFPADNEVGSWTRDADPIEVARNNQEALDLIDGEADAFVDREFVAFAMGGYVDGSNTLELRIWQFPDAAAAQDLYEGIVDEFGEYNRNWETQSLGDAARIVDSGTSWWLNARKGAYYVEVRVMPNDAGLRAANVEFATAVIGKIPS